MSQPTEGRKTEACGKKSYVPERANNLTSEVQTFFNPCFHASSRFSKVSQPVLQPKRNEKHVASRYVYFVDILSKITEA